MPNSKKRSWPDHLQELVQAYNNTPHSSTGFSPHYLLFGQEPRLPVDIFLQRPAPSAEEPKGWVHQHRKRLRAAHTLAAGRLKEEAAKRANRNPERGDSDLMMGALVRMRNRVLGRNKIQDRWRTDLHQVVRRPDDHGPVYTVRPRDGGPERAVNRSNLLQAKAVPPHQIPIPTPTPPLLDRPYRPRWAPEDDDEDDDDDDWWPIVVVQDPAHAPPLPPHPPAPPVPIAPPVPPGPAQPPVPRPPSPGQARPQPLRCSARLRARRPDNEPRLPKSAVKVGKLRAARRQ